MAQSRSDLLQGTLEMLVLHVLLLEPMHGWGISERIGRLSDEVFMVNQGSLYPALRRLQKKGWVQSAWQRTEANRRARYYELTESGRARVLVERKEWERTSGAVNRIVTGTG